jgi:hypothetical protein
MCEILNGDEMFSSRSGGKVCKTNPHQTSEEEQLADARTARQPKG